LESIVAPMVGVLSGFFVNVDALTQIRGAPQGSAHIRDAF